MSERKRINVSINPLHYDELQRICKDYKFANVCEICTALLSVFIQTVTRAEQNERKAKQTNEEMIQQMFAEFEQWEPTPDPSIMFKRHNHRAAYPGATGLTLADPETDGRDEMKAATDVDDTRTANEPDEERPGIDTPGRFF